MSQNTLYMETTSIDMQKTAREITAELVKAGATSVNADYAHGSLIGLRWILRIGGEDHIFDMPIRVAPIYEIFCNRRNNVGSDDQKTRDYKQAERVAWRQLLRWVQAQLAMIDTGMVSAEEVFLPYLYDPSSKRTLFQRMSETQFKQLEAPKQ